MPKKLETTEMPAGGGLQLISLERVAQKLDMSTYSIRRMQDSGKMPPAMQVGRKLLKWREDIIDEWIVLGCPADWQKTSQTAIN